MTKEDILKLEAGPELDALVAERVMGWSRWGHHWVTRSATGQTYYQAYCVEFESCVDCGQDEHAWSPSTDIAAAWEVVEKLSSDGWEVQITKDNYTTGYWYVALGHPLKTGIERIDVHGERVEGNICRAALLTTL